MAAFESLNTGIRTIAGYPPICRMNQKEAYAAKLAIDLGAAKRAEKEAKEKAAREALEKAGKEGLEEAGESFVKKGLKKGAGAICRKVPFVGAGFFIWDWSQGGFGHAVNEATWPVSEIWD